MKHLTYFFVVLLWSCSGEINSPKEQNQEVLDTSKQAIESVETDSIKDDLSANSERLAGEKAAFLSFYKKFTNAIIEKNLDKTNECVNTGGLYFIESDGALPHFQKVFDVKTFKTSQPQTFFNLPFLEIEKQPIFEVLPKIICAGEVYDKYGCFAEEVNHLKESGIWNYSDLNEKEKQAIQFAVETIGVTVVNTQNFTFYFSKTEEGWKLTFMDIRIPCTA